MGTPGLDRSQDQLLREGERGAGLGGGWGSRGGTWEPPKSTLASTPPLLGLQGHCYPPRAERPDQDYQWQACCPWLLTLAGPCKLDGDPGVPVRLGCYPGGRCDPRLLFSPLPSTKPTATSVGAPSAAQTGWTRRPLWGKVSGWPGICFELQGWGVSGQQPILSPTLLSLCWDI